MPPDQQSVCIDPIRRTCHQCHKIFSLDNGELIIHTLRQHNINPINLVGKSPIQHIKIETFTFLHLIKIGKESCTRQTAMCSKDTMRSPATDRQTCSGQMSYPLLQCFFRMSILGISIYPIMPLPSGLSTSS